MKYLKGRLTYHEENGDFGVAGMNEENQDEKLSACVAKLKDYEDLGFHPSDVEMFLRLYDEIVEKQDKLLSEIARIRHSNLLLEKELKNYQKAQPCFCAECGKPNFKSSKFCSHCGKKLRGV